ncbi:hypothetical protein ACIO52_32045 [Nocardia sp. NPDC087230]|uniref:hypothetical protein n=1 Tax=Nocardia sp. NPDC087230 TaxID=3364331 RepID=UPI00380C5BED
MKEVDHMATTPAHRRRAAARNKTIHFKAGDRVRVTYGAREVKGTVVRVSNGRVSVDLDFADEHVAGLFREEELRSA